MSDAFQITWTSGGGKFTDILDTQLFAFEGDRDGVLYRVRRGPGDFFLIRCDLSVAADSATLTYAEDEKNDRWWPGVMKIQFTDESRQYVKSVLWADPDDNFKNLDPTFERLRNLEADWEVQRQERLGRVASRPQQADFSARLRELYEERCAITGCATAEALEAAHIRVEKRAARGISRTDNNDLANGILLRADIHALFDSGCISLTPDGTKVETNKKLKADPTYQFLSGKDVYRPRDNAPSLENINSHRVRFGFV